MPLKVCVISGSRADFGLLLEPMRRLQNDPAFALSVVLTGQHLMAGSLDREARDNARAFAPVLVDMQIGSDDAVSVAQASGRAMAGLADAFHRLRPDIILLLGDRYEILCAALAATLARIPIAHIAGGDVTNGAMDDAFRHAITMMSHIHFVTTPAAARRVRQLGESADRIHLVGSPGLDFALAVPPMTRGEFFAAAGLVPKMRNILVTFHPITRTKNSIEQVHELTAVLDDLDDGVAILVTGSNADPEGSTIGRVMQEFAETHRNARFVASLGSSLYVNALRHMDAMVGNSSSGLYEAPSFALPSVNIGSRQDGRVKASSVIDCAAERGAIRRAIEAAFARGRERVENPYGDGHASERILAVLKTINDPQALLAKRFEDAAA
jgi:UDP-N-acetylglucosamine 2-epimerase (non-hydrolysing)